MEDSDDVDDEFPIFQLGHPPGPGWCTCEHVQSTGIAGAVPEQWRLHVVFTTIGSGIPEVGLHPAKPFPLVAVN